MGIVIGIVIGPGNRGGMSVYYGTFKSGGAINKDAGHHH